VPSPRVAPRATTTCGHGIRGTGQTACAHRPNGIPRTDDGTRGTGDGIRWHRRDQDGHGTGALAAMRTPPPASGNDVTAYDARVTARGRRAVLSR